MFSTGLPSEPPKSSPVKNPPRGEKNCQKVCYRTRNSGAAGYRERQCPALMLPMLSTKTRNRVGEIQRPGECGGHPGVVQATHCHPSGMQVLWKPRHGVSCHAGNRRQGLSIGNIRAVHCRSRYPRVPDSCPIINLMTTFPPPRRRTRRPNGATILQTQKGTSLLGRKEDIPTWARHWPGRDGTLGIPMSSIVAG